MGGKEEGREEVGITHKKWEGMKSSSAPSQCIRLCNCSVASIYIGNNERWVSGESAIKNNVRTKRKIERKIVWSRQKEKKRSKII